MSGALQFVAGAGLIVAGALTMSPGLVIAGASIIAAAVLATDARQQGVQQETAGQQESLIIAFGRARRGEPPYER